MADNENLPAQVQDDHQKIKTGQDTDQTSVDDNNPNKTMGFKRPNQPNEEDNVYNEVKNHVFSTSAGSNILSVSLIVSNVQYLKIVLDETNYKAKHYIELVLICASLLLQLILGFLVIINYTKTRTKYKMMYSTEYSPLVPTQTSQISNLKKLASCLAFLVLFINIVIAVLGFE